MLDQLDQMQVTVPIRTRSYAVSSYAIGPLDPAHILTLHAHLTTGQELRPGATAGPDQPERERAVMLEHREASSHIFDLGQHVLEVLDDRSVLVTDHEADKAVQLDQDESYRLLVVLLSVFPHEASA